MVQHSLGISRITASAYLNRLAADELLTKMKFGTGNYYINSPLVALFALG